MSTILRQLRLSRSAVSSLERLPPSYGLAARECLGGRRSVANDSKRPAQRIIGDVGPKKTQAKGIPNIKVTFVCNSGKKRIESAAHEGDTFLDVVLDNELDIDGFGACEGTLACSTCHLIFKKEDFERLEKKPTEDENDMLDMAYGLCETSRLGCQVHITKNLDGIEMIVPDGVHDARS